MKKIHFDVILAVIFILDIIIYAWNFHILKINTDSILNLTAIYAIVGTVLGSLFIFIMAEGLRDKEQPYKIKIFFNESKLITIIILFLFSLSLLPFENNNFIFSISLLSFFGFIILSMHAIYQITSITLNTEELWKKHINLFKNRIKEVIRFSQTIKSNIENIYNFIRKLKIKIRWLLPLDSGYTSLKSLKEGTIININLKDLENILEEIKKHEVKQNYKALESEKAENSEIKQSLELEQQSEKNKNSKDIILHIHIGQKIEKQVDLLSYDKKIQIDQKNSLEEKLNKAIIIRRTTVVDEVKAEMENYKSMVKKTIKEQNAFLFERYFSLYYELTKEFLDQLPEPYSYQEAKREISSFLDSNWPPLDWLRDHVMDFFNQARKEKSENQFKEEKLDEIYSKIKWFTYHLISLSKVKNDHLLFQMAFRLWIRQLYYLSSQKNNSDQKEKDIKDHIDFFESHLMSSVFKNSLEKRQIKKEEEKYAVFLLEVIKDIFGWILRKDKNFNFISNFENIITTVISNNSTMNFQIQRHKEYLDKKNCFQKPEILRF